jgi:hypothetical protein
MRASFRKGGKLEAEGRLSAVSAAKPSANHRRALTSVERALETAGAKARLKALLGQRVRAFSIPYGLERDAPPAATRSERCRTCAIGSHSLPAL